MKKILFVIFVLLISVSACSSYENCMRKHGQIITDTSTVYFEQVIPKDSIIVKIHIDSIKNDSIYTYSSDRAIIKFWKDKYTNMLNMQADCDSIIIRDTIQTISIRKNFAEKETKTPYWQSIKPLLLLLLIGGIILIIKIKF